jgi:tRNA (guanine-N7-)-methyltransferase
MGKDKLRRFSELHTFPNVIEADFEDVRTDDHPVKGNWRKTRFKNENPVVLELGCGKGEYTIKLAEVFPEKNFIGIDIKGNRMWVGAKKAIEEGYNNVNFLRTRIEFISSFFTEGEVDEIWITFPDPQMQSNRKRKRLTSPNFLNNYKTFLKKDGIVHLKTDSEFLFHYTHYIIKENNLKVLLSTDNLYSSEFQDLTHGVKTHYEQLFLAKGKPIHYLQFTLECCEKIIEYASK